MHALAQFAFFPKRTLKRYRDMLRVFGSIEKGLPAPPADLSSLGWTPDLVREFIVWRESFSPGTAEASLAREDISVCTIEDHSYPALLKEISDPPVALFIRGALEPRTPALAVVGARKCSPYGKQVTETLVSELTGRGVAIVSGLALGIDGIAHDAAIRSEGYTIAVLGSGVDTASIAPTSHISLANRILEHDGAIISEYPPGMSSQTFTFPERNRIIAGLCDAVLVIEAGETSGALITADCALQYNREVCAVPQNIFSPTSAGTNRLLRDGAHLVASAEDIFHLLHLPAAATELSAAPAGDSPEEQALLAALTREPIHIDVIAKSVKLPSHAVASTLTILEMKGYVRQTGGMMYIRSR